MKGLPTAHGFIRRTVYAGFLPFMHCCELRWSPSKYFLECSRCGSMLVFLHCFAMLWSCMLTLVASDMCRSNDKPFSSHSAHVFVPAHELCRLGKFPSAHVFLLQRLNESSSSPRCIVRRLPSL